jgi:hypothetical protein
MAGHRECVSFFKCSAENLFGSQASIRMLSSVPLSNHTVTGIRKSRIQMHSSGRSGNVRRDRAGIWLAGLNSNLSRNAGVSEAGARRRNPERSEGSLFASQENGSPG